jgi:hypothetical protein
VCIQKTSSDAADDDDPRLMGGADRRLLRRITTPPLVAAAAVTVAACHAPATRDARLGDDARAAAWPRWLTSGEPGAGVGVDGVGGAGEDRLTSAAT